MNLYGESGLCTLAKRIARAKYQPEWTEEQAKREAATYAATLLSAGRRSCATRRYFTALMNAFLEGVQEMQGKGNDDAINS